MIRDWYKKYGLGVVVILGSLILYRKPCNFGDNGNDGTLESGGANIPVSAGTYFIVMDLGSGTYTISPFSSDKRGMFYSDGQNLEIESIPPFEDGYAVTKWTNIDSNGNQGSDSSGNFVDTDIPLIRLAEIYLNYAVHTTIAL